MEVPFPPIGSALDGYIPRGNTGAGISISRASNGWILEGVALVPVPDRMLMAMERTLEAQMTAMGKVKLSTEPPPPQMVPVPVKILCLNAEDVVRAVQHYTLTGMLLEPRSISERDVG
jgi:hypothetical protein